MTLIVGLVGEDFGVLVSDSQETSSTGIVNHSASKIFRIGQNCAVGCSGSGHLLRTIMEQTAWIDNREPVDVSYRAERLAGALRAHQIRDTSSPGWWEPPCTAEEFRSHTIASPTDASALLVGFCGARKTPTIETIAFCGNDRSYSPMPSVSPRSIGLTMQADFILNEYMPEGVGNRTVDALTYLGVLCVIATRDRILGVDGNVRAALVTKNDVQALTKEELDLHIDRAEDTVRVWRRVTSKKMAGPATRQSRAGPPAGDACVDLKGRR
jgi:hypothetical protein